MATLLFWGPYMAHKGVINHRREKQRIKNYERWEGLRDDYDEQRKVTRESRSMDIQRTGTWDGQQFSPSPYHDEDRSYVSLRDQQEANDARTGWRPQECWDGPRTPFQAQTTGQPQPQPQPQQQLYTPQPPSQRPLPTQKTGATWDEALPTRLAVSRQSFQDYDYTHRHRHRHRPTATHTQSMPVSRDASQTRGDSFAHPPIPPPQPQDSFAQPSPTSSRQGSVSRTQTSTPSGLRESTPVLPSSQTDWMYIPLEPQSTTALQLPKNEFGFVDPARVAAGGRMAELIERGY